MHQQRIKPWAVPDDVLQYYQWCHEANTGNMEGICSFGGSMYDGKLG